jgi:predicted RNA-binding protein Jag
MEMEQVKLQVQKLLEFAGFSDVSVDTDSENKKITIFINEGEWLQKFVPSFVSDLEHILRLFARKQNLETVFVDINNYRKERERLIIELAQAAARKAITTKSSIDLPALNAYERRLVHTELATRPDVKTESFGEGKDRHVVIKPTDL